MHIYWQIAGQVGPNKTERSRVCVHFNTLADSDLVRIVVKGMWQKRNKGNAHLHPHTLYTSMTACEQGHRVPSERKWQHDKRVEGWRGWQGEKERGGEASTKRDIGKAFE